MRTAIVLAAALLGFLALHWVVATNRAADLRQWSWNWQAPPALQLAPEPPNEVRSPNFDPLAHLMPGEEMVATWFVSARSVGEMNDVRREAHREYTLKWQLGRGPAPEVALMVAALTDPLILFVSGFTGWRTFRAGRGVLWGVVAGVAAAAAGLSVQELWLQSLQFTRSASTTWGVLIIAAGALLLAILVAWLTPNIGRLGYQVTVKSVQALWHVGEGWQKLLSDAERTRGR